MKRNAVDLRKSNTVKKWTMNVKSERKKIGIMIYKMSDKVKQ